MTRPVPIPCGTPARYAEATWTVRARAFTNGEHRYWLSNAEGTVVGPLSASQVTRADAGDSAGLARALRRMGARR